MIMKQLVILALSAALIGIPVLTSILQIPTDQRQTTAVQRRLGSYIQDLLDEEIEKLAGDMPANSSDKYMLYFISGANNNILLHWLKTGAVESPYEIARVCAKYLKDGVLTD